MNEYERVAKAIRYIAENVSGQPSLTEIADASGLSESHFHRLFRRWVGITPKNYLQHLTALEARKLLHAGKAVLDAALDVGLSGPGRLHDLCVKLEAASPGEIASKGKGWEIKAGFAMTPFGEAFIAESPRGICRLTFLDTEEDRRSEVAALQKDWSGAVISRDDNHAIALARRIFRAEKAQERAPLQVLVKGTNFQIKVWRALLGIGPGELSTYREIAEQVESPRAHRAVGSAMGRNKLAFLIPCHRVIQSSGGMGGYRWGETRKKSMIALERAQETEGIVEKSLKQK